MTSSLKRRLEQLEEDCWRRTVEAVDRYLEGRSIADVEFFCANGYLPDSPILGRVFEPPRMSWHERWTQWKEFRRLSKYKTAEENEYFCIHGQWPATGGPDNENGSEDMSYFEGTQ